MSKESSLKSFQGIKKEIDALKKNRDLHKFVSKFNAEKKSLEKKIKKVVDAEIEKAKKFLKDKKKELNAFQKKIKAMAKKRGKK